MHDAGLAVGFLDGLHANAGVDQFPVRRLGGRIKNMQDLHPVRHALRPLLNQIAYQWDVVDADFDERRDVVGSDRAGQIGPAAFAVQKFRRPRGERPEQQGLFPFQHAGVEMRHGHRWRCVERLAIDLGLVPIDDLGIFADEPLSADRETAEALALGDAGFLQQMQAAAAGADEDKFRAIVPDVSGRQILDCHVPASGSFFQIDDPVAGGDSAPLLARQPRDELPRDHAEIHVGAGVHLRRGNRSLAATLDQQRRPAANRRAVGGVFHLPEKMVGRHPGVAGFQEIDLLVAVHKADVGDGIDKLARVVRQAFRHGIAPELLRMLELLENLDDLADIDRPVCLARRRVAQLADAGVPGAGVVPAVRTFLG